MLKEGDKAPDFSLETLDPNGSAGSRSLKDFANRTLVLYFYPRDNTPGCTREAQAFSAARSAIERAGGAVLAVSRDTMKTHEKFRTSCSLSVALASDPELKTHKAYGAWGEKTMYGRKVEGTIRSTFLIRDGRVARVWPSVKVDGHADAVLAAIAEGGTGTKTTKTPAPKSAKAPPTKAPAKKAAPKKAPAKKAAPKKAPAKKAPAPAKKAGTKTKKTT